MLKETIRINLRCPRHPRFDGAHDGYKANCPGCAALRLIWRKLAGFKEELRGAPEAGLVGPGYKQQEEYRQRVKGLHA